MDDLAGQEERGEESPAPIGLLGALQDIEEEMAGRIVPAERAVLLLSVSRAFRAAMKRVRPPAQVKAKRGLRICSRIVDSGLRSIAHWCRVTALDLSSLSIRHELELWGLLRVLG